MGNLLSKSTETVVTLPTSSEPNPILQNYQSDCLGDDDIVLIDNIQPDIPHITSPEIKPPEIPVEQAIIPTEPCYEPVTQPVLIPEKTEEIKESKKESAIAESGTSPSIDFLATKKRRNRRKRRVKRIHQNYKGVPEWAVHEYMKKQL
jgi:hypothetical protein